ncbi:MAG: hypothetical protein M0010_17490 [Actinomycetota bacterium]|nr:hypothetical protein [Actinomycetota bacterium]
MPPPVRRRRRRLLSRAGALGIAAVLFGALVLATLVGGLLREHSQSSGYERAVDRSYAAQGRLIVEESNRLGEELRTLLATMHRQHRASLELELDTLVRSAVSLAREAATAASPPPSGSAGADIASAMADRANAARVLRLAVDGLLGMAPLPVVGAPGAVAPRAPERRLSVTAAAGKLAEVGLLLAESDRSYAAGRGALRRAPGHALLPPSAWSSRTALTTGGAMALANALVSSSSLAAVHRVELVVHALVITPAPVPSPAAGSTPGGGPVSVLPPTGRIGLSVVVANDGNGTERGIVVRASVQGAAGTTAASSPGAGVTRSETSRRVSLSAGSSASVTLPAFRVVPGHRYAIAFAVDPPVPDTPGATTSDTITVQVAPPAPPVVGQLLPAKGPSGTDVTILGSDFTWVSAVTFGRTAARFKVVSSTQVTVVAPPGSGSVAVHVTNPGGSSASTPADLFRYRHS